MAAPPAVSTCTFFGRVSSTGMVLITDCCVKDVGSAYLGVMDMQNKYYLCREF